VSFPSEDEFEENQEEIHVGELEDCPSPMVLVQEDSDYEVFQF